MLPILVPPGLMAAPPLHSDQTTDLQDLLGIPYVEDGVQDEGGRWTTFGHPEKESHRPGLNCSGFVVATARRLLAGKLSLEQITRDRLGDSGPSASRGKDWDFGRDLVLNLSEGCARRWFLPEGTRSVREDGIGPQGFPIQDLEAWSRIFPRMQRNRIYLATLWRAQLKGPRHHNVALLLRDTHGRVWFYQTLPRGRSHRLGISAPLGFARLCTMFGPREWILILEVEQNRQ